MIVVLQHNRWSFGTRSTAQAAVEDWVDVAGAYGVPAMSVDGNDVLQVYDAAGEATARARAGDGMTIIIVETYRMLGHAQHDAQKYVPAEELAEWRARDPIRRFEAYLLEFGFESEASLAEIRSAVDAHLDEAVAVALDEEYPRGPDALEGVYADLALAPEAPWTRLPAGESVYDQRGETRAGTGQST